MCSIIPTDGTATMASHWCLTHDAPATSRKCADGPAHRAPGAPDQSRTPARYKPEHRAFPLPGLIAPDYDRAERFHTFGVTR